jgi:hypothetical protein
MDRQDGLRFRESESILSILFICGSYFFKLFSPTQKDCAHPSEICVGFNNLKNLYLECFNYQHKRRISRNKINFMKITKSIINGEGTLFPEVYFLLKTLPSEVINNKSHLLLAPDEIFALSSRRIMLAFKGCLDIISQVPANDVTINKQLHADFFNKLKELLDSMMAYVDDCYSILKTLHPTMEIKEIFVDKWLEKAKHPSIKFFKETIKEYRTSIAKYVNSIKHGHGRLRIVIGEMEVRNLIGYYMFKIEEVAVDGDKEILPVLDLNDARSLHFDLKYHLYNYYYLGEVLQQAIIKAIKFTYRINLTTGGSFKQSFYVPEFNEVIERVAGLPNFTFPNKEFFQPKAQIVYNRTSGKTDLILNYPNEINPLYLKLGSKGTVSIKQKEDHNNEIEINYPSGLKVMTLMNMPIIIGFIGGDFPERMHVKIMQLHHRLIKIDYKYD